MEKIIVSKTLGLQGSLDKIILSTLCLAGFFLHVGFSDGCPLLYHLLYSFSHANLFHLAINLIVLWNIRNKIRPISSLTIAILASFLPMYVREPTMGMSGLLFASFGQMWGKTGRLKDVFIKVMPFVVCTMIIPNVNGLLHLYSFCIGYFYSYIILKFRF